MLDLLIAWGGTSDSSQTEMSHLASQFYTNGMLVLATCADTAIHTTIDVQRQAEWIAAVTSRYEWKCTLKTRLGSIKHRTIQTKITRVNLLYAEFSKYYFHEPLLPNLTQKSSTLKKKLFKNTEWWMMDKRRPQKQQKSDKKLYFQRHVQQSYKKSHRNQ